MCVSERLDGCYRFLEQRLGQLVAPLKRVHRRQTSQRGRQLSVRIGASSDQIDYLLKLGFGFLHSTLNGRQLAEMAQRGEAARVALTSLTTECKGWPQQLFSFLPSSLLGAKLAPGIQDHSKQVARRRPYRFSGGLGFCKQSFGCIRLDLEQASKPEEMRALR